jgi:hypothetical protein
LAESAKDRPQSVAQLTRLLYIDKPTARVGMASSNAGLAPLLSSPVVGPSEPGARPARTRPGDTAPDAEAVLPGAAQLSLPWVLPSPADAATVDNATADSAANPQESNPPIDAALAAEPGPSRPADVLGTAGSRSRIAKVAGSLMLVAMFVAAVSLWMERARPDVDQAKTTGSAGMVLPATAPMLASAPVLPSPRQPAAPTDIRPTVKSDARAGTQLARSAAPVSPQSKPASPKEPRKPAAAKGQAPITAKSRANEASPRQVCAGKERYALLQCMETQCAKKTWVRHEQCVRLRQERRL